MDITELGATYMDNFRLGGNLVNHANSEVNNTSGFENVLRAAAPASAPQADPTEVPKLSSGTAVIDKTDKLYEQCVELEIFMVKTLITSMRNTVQKSGLIDEGFAGKMYEDMLYDEYTRVFTQNANFGMADLAYLELTGQRGKTVVSG